MGYIWEVNIIYVEPAPAFTKISQVPYFSFGRANNNGRKNKENIEILARRAKVQKEEIKQL